MPFHLCCAIVAAFLAAAALASAADARRPVRKAPGCGPIHSFTPRSGATHVAVVSARGFTCRSAKTIVRRCMSGTLDRRWKATSPDDVTWLRRGRRAASFRVVSGTPPRCLQRNQLRIKPAPGLLMAVKGDLHQARPLGNFGPFETPKIYPDRWPGPYKMLYEWDTPVATHSASLATGSVSTVRLLGHVHNPDGRVRSAWIEWGKTRDLGTSSEKQAPGVRPDNGPVEIRARFTHLQAGTRYYWRTVANIEDASGAQRVHYGTLGSFVTNPYAKIANPARPCTSSPTLNESGQLFELTESLAIACASPVKFTKGACFPACSNFYSGKLTCNKDFPRNLNAGSWSFNLPKIGLPISIDNLVNYWRSNDSNRFLTLPGKNSNSGGGQVGPTPGWHNWDVAQWAYPFTPTSTTADFWINCTEQWGNVIGPDALSAGEGSDRASSTPPGVPTGLRAVATNDGGVDVSWQAPSATSPSGLAGYHLAAIGWKPTDPKVLAPNAIPAVTTTTLKGHITATNLKVLAAAVPAGVQSYIAVASVSREGSLSDFATIAWPPR